MTNTQDQRFGTERPAERPAEAMKFRQPETGQFSVAAADAGGKHAVKIVAFSGREFTHWYWGRCIFDRAGAVIPFDKIPIDFNHDPKEAIGFLDTFGGSPALECSGYLVPFREGDRAGEILYKKEQGVPYQCSVMLGDSGFEFEYVKPGKAAEVNGITAEGGLDGIVIFRKYEIHGVAVCLYGSDNNTAVFNHHYVTHGEQAMTKDLTKEPDVSGRELAKKFAARFGNDRGFRFFTEGLDEQAANAKAFEEVAAESEAKDTTIADLEQKVAELAAKVAELEAKVEGASESKEKPVNSEEFSALKAENMRLKQAAGFSAGTQPVAGNEPVKMKKEFSVLPESTRNFAAKFRKQ